MSREEEAFLAALDADPADYTTMLVYADWLKERDDPRELGYRWMVKSGRTPKHNHNTFAGLMAHRIGCWEWWWDRAETKKVDEADRIPMSLMVRMRCDYPYRIVEQLWSLDYLTYREAIGAVADAFHLLPQDTQDALMNEESVCEQA